MYEGSRRDAAPDSHRDAKGREVALRRRMRARAVSVDPARYQDARWEDCPEGFLRAVLHRDDEMEVVALRWRAGGAAPLHGHGDSAALMRLLSGRLREEHFVPAGGEAFAYGTAELGPGGESWLPGGAFHRVEALTEAEAVHVYAPPLVDPNAPVPEHLRPRLVPPGEH